jgi:hypothetical protein
MQKVKAAAIGLAAAAIAVAAPLDARAPASTTPRPDLANVAEGVYAGSVISDARGAGQADVTITVTKTAPNTVSITSSYDRLPPFTIKLSRAMNTIQQVGTSVVFLLNLSKTPHGLDITDDEASWSGSKQ